MQSTAADPLLGQVLEGRYRVLSRLAVGGMSTVYVGIDHRLDREIAVKVMNPALSTDPAFLERFSREARAAARLSHVNAVAVHDQGSDAGNVFLVMELVRGRTVRELIRERGLLSPAEAVSLMEPVLAALSAAHRAGLVHRDVKPENILLSDDGVVKVADFGLARAVEANASSTRTGQMMGTVAYSSPEQFRGHHIDMRSDVYSAGIVLFELLTGYAPYQGANAMAVAYQHVHSDVPPPSSRQRGVAAPLDHLVLRATSRDPNRRPPDAGILLAELHDVRQELRLPVIAVPRRPRPSSARTGPTVPIHPAPVPRPPAGRSGLVSPTTPTARAAGMGAPGRPVTEALPGGPSRPLRPPGSPTGSPIGPSAGPPPGPTGRSMVSGPMSAPPKRRRWLRTTIGAVILLLICALLIVASWWWASGRYSSLDDVRKQPVTAAVKTLTGQGYEVVVDPAKDSDTVPKGAVISTDPAAGARLVRGRTVHVVPSAGPAYYPVPTVGTDMTKAQAAGALKPLADKGVTVTYQQAASDNVASGNVISTAPVADTQVKRGDTITVTISTGPPILDVPGVTGQSGDQATRTLQGMGFKVNASQAFSDTVPAGVVITQDPAAAAKLAKFQTVNLVVSKGQDLVTIPALNNLEPVASATSKLQNAGLVVKVEKAYGGSNGLVVGMSPASGTKVKRGSTVTITII